MKNYYKLKLTNNNSDYDYFIHVINDYTIVIGEEINDGYKMYLEDLEAVSTFYVNNMNKITR